MYSYFHRDKNDADFFTARLISRLPDSILDAHMHFNLPAHVSAITPEEIAGDWALECGLLMSYEDAKYYTGIMFPNINYLFLALPWPLRNADTVGNNRYIAELIQNFGIKGLFSLRPEYKTDYIEEAYIEGGFCGFKPYPYMASPVKGAEISIFDFMPHAQFVLANQLKAAVLMHLPRAGRLPDLQNIREIRLILDKYPDIKLVLAHFGRCFCSEHFEAALEILGEDVHRLWFDSAAVLNPSVYKLAFRHLDFRRILFGTDLPIMLWHGKREWDESGYHNLCRENFSWNKHKYPEQENQYTFFIYEQMNNILDIIGDNTMIRNAVFHDNAANLYVPSPK